MKFVVRTAAGVLLATSLAAWQAPDLPPVSEAQRLFEAGQYGPALEAITAMRERGEAGLAEAYLAAQVFLRQNQSDPARQEVAQLAASDDPIWRLVGESTTATLDGDVDRALDLATQAVNTANQHASERLAAGTPPDQSEELRDFHAFYQLGLVKARKEEWTGSAEAFERAVQLRPNFAYAHYYAGYGYSRLRRLDRVAMYFDRFLALAPNAPERTAVMSIMRTIRR